MENGEIEVELTPSQVMVGATVGVMRQVSNIKIGRKPRYGAGDENDWQMHIEGCLGEMALASWLGVFWDGKIHDLSNGDVGKLEVRTRSKDWHSLIIHPGDSNLSAFVLVTGVNGLYRLSGWILGAEGKVDSYWKDPAGGRPAYFVDHTALRPMSSLKDWWLKTFYHGEVDSDKSANGLFSSN